MSNLNSSAVLAGVKAFSPRCQERCASRKQALCVSMRPLSLRHGQCLIKHQSAHDTSSKQIESLTVRWETRLCLEAFESFLKILEQVFNVFYSHAHTYEAVFDSLLYSSLTRYAGMCHASWVLDERFDPS